MREVERHAALVLSGVLADVEQHLGGVAGDAGGDGAFHAKGAQQQVGGVAVVLRF